MIIRILRTLPFMALMFASACASIIEGSSQEIAVNTNPAGANCALNRQGITIGRVSPTPGAVTIKKTKHDLIIVCAKSGFHEDTYFNNSDSAGATFGNIILGGGIGWAIDSASGSDNKYTSPVNVTLVPLTEPKPAPQSSDQKPPTTVDEESGITGQ